MLVHMGKQAGPKKTACEPARALHQPHFVRIWACQNRCLRKARKLHGTKEGQKNSMRPDKAKMHPNMHLAPAPHLGRGGFCQNRHRLKVEKLQAMWGPKQTTIRPDKAKMGPNMHRGPAPYWETWVLSKPMPAKSRKVTKQGGTQAKHHATR